MVEVNLYQPGIINRDIQFPSEWNDLSVYELHKISQALLTEWDTTETCKAKILTDILQHRLGKTCRNITQKMDPEDVVISGFELLSFIFEENSLTKQPYSRLKLPGLIPYTVYGPVDDFNNLTCGEFEDAEQSCFAFNETPGHEHLARLAAILYRPKNTPFIKPDRKTGKCKVYDYEKKLKRYARLQPWQLYTIYIWYTGCRNELPKIFPTVHESGNSSEPDPMIFTKCIHSGAGAKNGTRDQIRMMLLKEYFFDMEQESIKIKELNKANA